MSSMDDIINFVNIEFDNPQLMISLLVKFSRKFAETNVYTKLKSILVLHKLMENVKESAQVGLLKSVRSLRIEKDEKVDMLFFSPDSIEKSAELANNVAEIQAVELARVYSAYVFNFIDTKGMQPSSTTTSSSSSSKASAKDSKSIEDIEDRMNALVNLVNHGDEVEICIKRTFTPLGQQCLDAVKEDRSWIMKELKKLYVIQYSSSIANNNKEGSSNNLENRDVVEELLSKYDTKFIRIKPTTTATITTTSPSIDTTTSSTSSSTIIQEKEKHLVEGESTSTTTTNSSINPAQHTTNNNDNDNTINNSITTRKTIKTTSQTNPTSSTKQSNSINIHKKQTQVNVNEKTKKTTSNNNKTSNNSNNNNTSNTTTKSNSNNKPIVTTSSNKKTKK